MRYEEFVDLTNKIGHRNFRYFDNKARKKFDYLKKSGVTDLEFETVITNAYKDKYHKETSFQYLTPSFLLRPEIVERYLNIVSAPSKLQTSEDEVKNFDNFINNLLIK